MAKQSRDDLRSLQQQHQDWILGQEGVWGVEVRDDAGGPYLNVLTDADVDPQTKAAIRQRLGTAAVRFENEGPIEALPAQGAAGARPAPRQTSSPPGTAGGPAKGSRSGLRQFK
jgi:hypothetical protein